MYKTLQAAGLAALLLGCGGDDHLGQTGNASTVGNVADAQVEQLSDASVSSVRSNVDAAVSIVEDAATIDAALEPNSVLDGADVPCPLDRQFTYYFVSQSGMLNPLWTIHTDGTVGRSVMGDGTLSSCLAPLPSCGSASIDGADLTKAIDDPAVAASFGPDDALVLGKDTRGAGGNVLVIALDSATRITVGSPCDGTDTACRAIPPAVQQLVDLLNQLSVQVVASAGPCAGN